MFRPLQGHNHGGYTKAYKYGKLYHRRVCTFKMQYSQL